MIARQLSAAGYYLLFMKKSKIIFRVFGLCWALNVQFYVQATTQKPGPAPQKLRMTPRLHSYTRPTVTEPFPDGISLQVPKELGNWKLAVQGLVDVTAAPFHADATGVKDSTKALQEAINFARNHQMVSFLPSGIYLVSDTLCCVQDYYLRSHGIINAGRRFPCVLMGSRNEPRPKIVLAPNSSGYGDLKNPKYVIHFWARSVETGDPQKPQPNISFGQMFVNIDITIGPGNPGAVAIRHRAAQGSSIQDCTIDATHGLTGVEGGAGSGGGHHNITVIGGKIGFDLRETQPASTISGITLIHPAETAIFYSGRQALSAVGIKIVSKSSGPLIRVTNPRWAVHNGQICLVDSEIVFDRKNATEENIVLESDRAVYFRNVYVDHADYILKNPQGSELKGNPNGWQHVREIAYVQEPPRWKNLQYRAPVYINGKRRAKDWIDAENNPAPPRFLQTQHMWPKDFPTWQDKNVVSVKQDPYYATGDGKTDDTWAIQEALDENEIVYLPKGYYRVSRTIKLHSESRLVGTAPFHSLLLVRDSEGDFADTAHPQPVVQTVDDAQADTILAFCGIYVAREVGGAYALNWRAGKKSIVRSVDFIRRQLYGHSKHPQGLAPYEYDYHFVVICGHGGGHWYNFYQESHRHVTKDYRHLLIEGTRQPLQFYQCNAENSHSKTNIEIRQASHVMMFGVKGEGNIPILWVHDSDHIRVFGYGGNAAAHEDTALHVFERTPNFLLAQIVDSPRLAGAGPEKHFAGRGVDPKRWHMISDNPGQELRLTRPMDRPVLYRRGTP